jgi:uncharacterized protein
MDIKKTPGVDVQEVGAVPPAIVGVETAVPAFIGYTQKAEQNGHSLLLQPVRIGSMAEYQGVFGNPYQHKFALTALSGQAAGAADATLDKPYRLDPQCRFRALRQFAAVLRE